ncbi:hypothetical protein D9M70_586970 [compost metagenome]
MASEVADVGRRVQRGLGQVRLEADGAAMAAAVAGTGHGAFPPCGRGGCAPASLITIGSERGAGHVTVHPQGRAMGGGRGFGAEVDRRAGMANFTDRRTQAFLS